MSVIDDILNRLAVLEEREHHTLKQLKAKLADDLQPDAATFLLPQSVTADALSPELMQGRLCTSTTRPSPAYEGLMIYETDTNNTRIYDGAAWQPVAP